MIELVNVPVPVPFVVKLLSMVGFELVFQHIPLAVTIASPSLKMIPPQVAEVVVILVISDVDSDGSASTKPLTHRTEKPYLGELFVLFNP